MNCEQNVAHLDESRRLGERGTAGSPDWRVSRESSSNAKLLWKYF